MHVAESPLTPHASRLTHHTPPVARKVVLLGAGYTTRNMGVWALASGAITSILHSLPAAQVRLFDYDRQPASYHVRYPGGTAMVDLINIRFSKNLLSKNNIARLILTAMLLPLMPAPAKARLLSANPFLSVIAEADIIASIAGGDSFSDIYGLRRLLYVSLPQILALLMDKPLVLLPQTLGPFESPLARIIARYILRRAATVYARDRESLAQIQPLLGADPSRCRFCYDLAFALEPLPPSAEGLTQMRKLESRRPLVGLNVSGLLHMGGYTRDNMFGLKSDYRQLVRDIIRFFVEQQKLDVLLVPHVMGSARNPESDMLACAQVYQELAGTCGGRLHSLEGTYDQHEIKYAIGRCDFFLGSRMHACIAALSQCVPAIGLAYSSKFAGVFETLNTGDLVIDLRMNDQAEALARIRDTFLKRKTISAQLQTTMPGVKRAVLELFSAPGAASS